MLFSLAYTRPLFVVVRKLNVVDAWTLERFHWSTHAIKVTILQEAAFTVCRALQVPTSLATKLSSNRRRRQWQNEIIPVSLLLVDYARDLTAKGSGKIQLQHELNPDLEH